MLRRMITMLNEVGNVIGIENRINLDILNNGDPPEEIRAEDCRGSSMIMKREKITLINLV